MSGQMPMVPTPGAGGRMPMVVSPDCGDDMADRPAVTLADFLLARIGEDEAEIRLLVAPGAQYGTPWHWRSRARLDAECEAKRRIVALHFDPSDKWDCPSCREEESFDEDSEGNREWFSPRVSTPCSTLRALGAVYADHPDYRVEWRP